MKITSLSQQKNKKFYNVFVDGQFLCSADADLIFTLNLFTGKELDDEKISQLKKLSSEKKAFNLSLNYLSYSMRTQREIEVYLKGKGFGEKIIVKAIEKLKSYKYIDDENYMDLYIKNKMAEGHSKKKILYSLLKKGIEEEGVKSALDSIYLKETELAHLKKEVEKLDSKLKGFPYRQRVSKVNDNLLRKGYTYQDISRVIREVMAKDEPNEAFDIRLDKLVKKYMDKYSKKTEDPKEVRQKTIQALYRKGYDIDTINKCYESIEE